MLSGPLQLPWLALAGQVVRDVEVERQIKLVQIEAGREWRRRQRIHRHEMVELSLKELEFEQLHVVEDLGLAERHGPWSLALEAFRRVVLVRDLLQGSKRVLQDEGLTILHHGGGNNHESCQDSKPCKPRSAHSTQVLAPPWLAPTHPSPSALPPSPVPHCAWAKASILRRGGFFLVEAGSREQGAGSREHGAGSREHGAGSREQGAGSREQEKDWQGRASKSWRKTMNRIERQDSLLPEKDDDCAAGQDGRVAGGQDSRRD
eukprot:756481-Hanusia_phi.AAC.4